MEDGCAWVWSVSAQNSRLMGCMHESMGWGTWLGLLWMFRPNSAHCGWSWTICGVWMVWCEIGGRGGRGGRGHILHWSLNPLSLSAALRLGRFGIWKDIAAGIYWGIYSRGGAAALHWRTHGYLGKWGPQTSEGSMERVLYRQRSSDRNIQRPCIQWTFVLTSTLRQCYKYPASTRNVCSTESLCL